MPNTILRLIIISGLVIALSACQAPPEAPPPEAGDILFYADETNLQSGECTFLRWEVFDGSGVTLNGAEVPAASEAEVCPGQTQPFELVADRGSHLESRVLEITVIGDTDHPEEDPAPVNEAADQVSGEVLAITPGEPAYLTQTWITTGGPPGGLGYDIRMDPRNPDVMYVTDAWAGVFKSTDGGNYWVPTNNGITARIGPSGDAIPVFSLNIDPNNPDTLWAGTQFGGGVFRSDDGGENWRAMNEGIQEFALTVRGFTVEPGNSDVVYMTGEISSWEWNGEALPGLGLDMTKGVVYKTTNGGQNWERKWFGDNLTRYTLIHPEDPDLVYVSTGIFDREAANSDPVTLDPGGVGILRSHDGGDSWEVLDSRNGFRENELYFGSLFMHPDNPDILIAAAGNDPYLTALGGGIGAVYLTEDGGDRWERVLDLPNASVVEMCTGDPNVVYAASFSGVHRSMDGGHTWIEVAGHLWGSEDVMAGFPIDMQCDPRDAMRIFVNNYIGGNLLSIDGGVTWTIASNGYTGALLRQVDVNHDDPAHVYSSSRMGVFVSTEGGFNWQGTAHAPARYPEAVVVAADPFDGNHIIAVSIDAGPEPAISHDSGETWAFVDTGLWSDENAQPGLVTRVVFSPYEKDLVLATAGALHCTEDPRVCEEEPGFGVIRSVDGGSTWARTTITDEQVVDLQFVSQNTVYAAAYPGTIYRSEDAGQTWQVVSQDLHTNFPSTDPDAFATKSMLLSIAIDPSNFNKLFAGFAYGGLMISTDGGATWDAASAGLLPEMSIVDIEADNLHPGVFYLGSSTNGMLYSTDGGATWITNNDGLVTRAVTDLALSADGSVLYLAANGGGVFRLGTPVEN
jgi:photosystem II stability/assembly factor-like uncharacterized protein